MVRQMKKYYIWGVINSFFHQIHRLNFEDTSFKMYDWYRDGLGRVTPYRKFNFLRPQSATNSMWLTCPGEAYDLIGSRPRREFIDPRY
ncbi:hypothetical protein EUGRSUZ_D00046 [Eucalyptus grandis]|uniref:Uncharacterized protein n=2 Tax=Eucalyptus grandis TaxID=71139 RepID=A0ACC3L3U1_EUCGR|nr:hypothetical protein EUGRSUZ_D00046 [Eucalyptus grandis]